MSGSAIGSALGTGLGAVGGGLIGSVVPGLGTAVGASIGAGVGGAAGGGIGGALDQPETPKTPEQKTGMPSIAPRSVGSSAPSSQLPVRNPMTQNPQKDYALNYLKQSY